LLEGLKFFGTNSGAFGDKTCDIVFTDASGSSKTVEVKPPFLGMNGSASGEKDEAACSLATSAESSAKSNHTSTQHDVISVQSTALCCVVKLIFIRFL